MCLWKHANGSGKLLLLWSVPQKVNSWTSCVKNGPDVFLGLCMRVSCAFIPLPTVLTSFAAGEGRKMVNV